ncbi:MAG TPA: hypothetical protein VF840_12040, partial [Terriglobales bacterium]
ALSSVLVVRVTTSACGACGFDFDRLRSGPFEGPATGKASGSAGGSLQKVRIKKSEVRRKIQRFAALHFHSAFLILHSALSVHGVYR